MKLAHIYTEIQRYRNTEIQKYRNTAEIQIYRVSSVFEGTESVRVNVLVDNSEVQAEVRITTPCISGAGYINMRTIVWGRFA